MARNANNAVTPLEMIQRLAELESIAADMPEGAKLRLKLAECQGLVMDAHIKSVKAGAGKE